MPANSSVRTALLVLEEVSRRQPVGVSDLARALELPKSTVQRALTTLADAGWLTAQAEAGSRWVLAAKAAAVGRRAEINGLREAASEVMHRLQAATGETVNLMVPEGSEIVLVDRVDSCLPVRTHSTIGTRVPIAASGNGKAMLAFMPRARVEQLVRDGLKAYTERTVTDPERFLDELVSIRACGYAVNRGEWRADVTSVAAPVLRAGRPVGALSVSLPAHRLTPTAIDRFGPLVRKAADEIQAKLG